MFPSSQGQRGLNILAAAFIRKQAACSTGPDVIRYYCTALQFQCSNSTSYDCDLNENSCAVASLIFFKHATNFYSYSLQYENAR